MAQKQKPENKVETMPVKISRALFAPDGKDHFIIRNEDFSIYADTTNKEIVSRSRWCFEKDLEQYWEAEVKTVAKTGTRYVRLIKKIRKDLKWEDYPEENNDNDEEVKIKPPTKRRRTTKNRASSK